MHGAWFLPLPFLTTHLTHDDGIKTWQQNITVIGFKGEDYRPLWLQGMDVNDVE